VRGAGLRWSSWIGDLNASGHESSFGKWRPAKMILAIRGIDDGNLDSERAGGFQRAPNKGLKACQVATKLGLPPTARDHSSYSVVTA
jgi:hypothetical protein